MTWHDGSPLVASDVVYSYGRIRESANNGWRFGTVTDVSAADDTTVVFTLSAPTPNLLSHLGAFKGMAIVQEANVESGDITTAPIGSGPFALAEWTSGDFDRAGAQRRLLGRRTESRRRDLSLHPRFRRWR